MATYIIKEHNDYNSFKDTYTKRYIIYKKCWYGLSWKAQTNDIDEVSKMTDNLIKQGNLVLKHWTITEDI